MTDSGEYGIRTGTYEEALTWLGRVSEPRTADFPVELAAGRKFAAAVQDGNPLWWDSQVADEVAGGAVVPPATLMSWAVAHHWLPEVMRRPAVGTFLITVPLPGESMINVHNEIEFFDHLRVGDQLTVTEVVESISTEKTTGAGRGHFLTVAAWYRRSNGEPVAMVRNVILRICLERTDHGS
ncbi:MaoC family dehydratase N-terminal domain-containing protein [Nocardioides sp. Bht2]|uniref:FAS1-like dehydratase domain-containing protein n=1 Tax=Nocardioides sp. Bht2 TaxID=3392297 RepID=UPI0039B63E48